MLISTIFSIFKQWLPYTVTCTLTFNTTQRQPIHNFVTAQASSRIDCYEICEMK